MYLWAKNTLKSNHYHTSKHPLKHVRVHLVNKLNISDGGKNY